MGELLDEAVEIYIAPINQMSGPGAPPRDPCAQELSDALEWLELSVPQMAAWHHLASRELDKFDPEDGAMTREVKVGITDLGNLAALRLHGAVSRILKHGAAAVHLIDAMAAARVPSVPSQLGDHAKTSQAVIKLLEKLPDDIAGRMNVLSGLLKLTGEGHPQYEKLAAMHHLLRTQDQLRCDPVFQPATGELQP